MIASELISYEIPSLKLDDTIEKAFDLMEEFKLVELPVVDQGVCCGLISEEDILDSNNSSEAISSFERYFKKPFVRPNQHLFEVIGELGQKEVTVLPVINNEEYVGVITTDKVLKALANTISVINPGSIITLEVNVADYSLAEISKMVESDDAKILTSYLTSHADSTKLEVTLKINKTDISRIIHTFERFNYVVTASYNESEYHDDLKNRYDEFMRFLNI